MHPDPGSSGGVQFQGPHSLHRESDVPGNPVDPLTCHIRFLRVNHYIVVHGRLHNFCPRCAPSLSELITAFLGTVHEAPANDAAASLTASVDGEKKSPSFSRERRRIAFQDTVGIHQFCGVSVKSRISQGVLIIVMAIDSGNCAVLLKINTSTAVLLSAVRR
ncbi:hypothetical protein Y032_0010g866 [Ancylostoma ceylanicum]|uniref:Uncharacterized protein n=1 Tax=Ancylostoma ceylanicum TaxID=53326 RepID=A0A016VHY9_9BILA|nr:hypothetical protein Y032_0010g866 [Ancylostoma ceylanicum]